MNRLDRILCRAACCVLFGLSSGVSAFDYFQTLPLVPLVPEDNPQSENKIRLGKHLFYDRALSIDRSISCNSCHNLLSGGDNDLALTIGVNGKTSRRSAPGLWNIGLQTVLYWDGRAQTLELQALDHLKDDGIMGISKAATLIKRLSKISYYRTQFMKVFGDRNPINMQNISKALASFQRALLAPNSPFDRYMNGNKQAMSVAAVKGKEVFNRAGCLACHFGTTFAGPAPGPAMGMGDGFYELFPNYTGSRYDKLYRLTEDLGRYHFSKDTGEKYMWRVPPLRNIALTAPYFHNGTAKTLREAIRIMAKTQLEKTLTEEEIDQLVAFLNSLTGELPAVLRSVERFKD